MYVSMYECVYVCIYVCMCEYMCVDLVRQVDNQSSDELAFQKHYNIGGGSAKHILCRLDGLVIEVCVWEAQSLTIWITFRLTFYMEWKQFSSEMNSLTSFLSLVFSFSKKSFYWKLVSLFGVLFNQLQHSYCGLKIRCNFLRIKFSKTGLLVEKTNKVEIKSILCTLE